MDFNGPKKEMAQAISFEALRRSLYRTDLKSPALWIMKKYLDEIDLGDFVDLIFDLSGVQFSDDSIYVVCAEGNMIEMLASPSSTG